jgi:hypothetical protein
MLRRRMTWGKGRNGARAAALAAILSVLALAAPAGASAAYAPQLAVSITPTDQPGKPIGLTSVVTQASDEEASRKVVVHFPVGIAFNIAALQAKPSCTPAQRDAKACPEGSRIGTATADTSVGTLQGGVFLGVEAQIYIFLQNSTLALLGLEPKPITGRTEFRPDGGTDTVLDDLPTDVTATRFELAITGPQGSVLSAPEFCGPLAFRADFTAKSGATATSSSTVTVTGCPPPEVTLSRVRLSSRRVRAGRAITLAYTLNQAAAVEVTLRRSGKARVLRRIRRAAAAGVGRVRVPTTRLAPGAYVVTIRARAGGKTASRPLLLRVVRAPRRR